jgi:hypothetical protein
MGESKAANSAFFAWYATGSLFPTGRRQLLSNALLALFAGAKCIFI